MKYILIIISILMLASCSDEQYITNNLHTFYPPEYKYEVRTEGDIGASLTGAIKYEILLHKETKKVFDSQRMVYIDKIVYYPTDAMFPKYRVTFSSGSVRHYYLQPCIQGGYDLLLDKDVQ